MIIKDARVAFILASSAVISMVASSPLHAAGKSHANAGEATQKLIAESSKMRVYDIVERPGQTGPKMSRLGQFIYTFDGGTIERTFADGSKVVIHRKAGESYIVDEKRPYSVRNVGDTTIHIIAVEPK